eukprot:scaffold1376_cov125-Cylindrotheca_fusiformis.AAC.11
MDDFFDDEDALVAQMLLSNTGMMFQLVFADNNLLANIDHRMFARKPRKKYNHDRALRCIQEDYLCDVPRFDGREFDIMFRVSKRRFQRMMEDIMQNGDPFYKEGFDAFGAKGSSVEAKLLLPLKTMAYGVPPHCFRDYFQMSRALAIVCCEKFYTTIKQVYEEEYLRIPTADDLKNIVKLHKHQHKVDGMIGSLDCMHRYWKNCPVAWQGSFRGKEKRPSIVLEAASDYNLFFWHAAYGFAGTLNDLNILNLSPLLRSLVDGTFIGLEQEAEAQSVIQDEMILGHRQVVQAQIHYNNHQGVYNLLTDEERWSDLTDIVECSRLRESLMRLKSEQSQQQQEE